MPIFRAPFQANWHSVGNSFRATHASKSITDDCRPWKRKTVYPSSHRQFCVLSFNAWTIPRRPIHQITRLDSRSLPVTYRSTKRGSFPLYGSSNYIGLPIMVGTLNANSSKHEIGYNNFNRKPHAEPSISSYILLVGYCIIIILVIVGGSGSE